MGEKCKEPIGEVKTHTHQKNKKWHSYEFCYVNTRSVLSLRSVLFVRFVLSCLSIMLLLMNHVCMYVSWWTTPTGHVHIHTHIMIKRERERCVSIRGGEICECYAVWGDVTWCAVLCIWPLCMYVCVPPSPLFVSIFPGMCVLSVCLSCLCRMYGSSCSVHSSISNSEYLSPLSSVVFYPPFTFLLFVHRSLFFSSICVSNISAKTTYHDPHAHAD